MPCRWPWVGDSDADAARRIALSYRDVLEKSDDAVLRDRLDTLDSFWLNLGASWVKPTQASLHDDDWLPAPRLAELLCVRVRQIYDWGRRGHIETDMICGVKHYRAGDAIAYMKRRHNAHGAAWT